MKNHEMVMSIRETQRLTELERVIAKGQKTFVPCSCSRSTMAPNGAMCRSLVIESCLGMVTPLK